MMPSGALLHMALEGEPVDEGSPSYSVALWSLGLTPWPSLQKHCTPLGVPVGTRDQDV